MPFDDNSYQEQYDPIMSLSKQHRLKLAAALRDGTMERLGHKWYFPEIEVQGARNCKTCGCALGLARVLWPQHEFDLSPNGITQEWFGLNEHVASSIFFTGYPCAKYAVTPEMVAERLEAIP